MSNWTREHDALIARVAEGATEIRKSPPATAAMSHTQRQQVLASPSQWTDLRMTLPDGCGYPLANYSTDIAACIRAAEAWRIKPGTSRVFGIRSEDLDEGSCVARLQDFIGTEWVKWEGRAAQPNYADALARALYAACGGE